MDFFKPDYFFDHFSDISVEWLKEQNIRTILSDLDGTLTAHNEMGNAQIKAWIDQLFAHEITLIIVSNNQESRVNGFTENYQLVGYSNCQKPDTKVIEKNLFEKGLDPKTTAFLGDQLFTDVWCGKRLGVKTILVKPIPGKDPFQIKLKRKAEKIIMKSWEWESK